MRLALFTDTLGDVNGVSRFILNIASCAEGAGREMLVLASTRFAIPERANLRNLPPRLAMRLPGYPQLEVTLPPREEARRAFEQFRPDAVHVSTPGPVGLLGRRLALTTRVPLLGTYHTDFPAYIDHLFGDHVLTRAAAAYMRWFYRPFDRLFTRSDEYVAALRGIGIPSERVLRLRPGIETSRFGPALRDATIWRRLAGESPDLAALAAPGRTVLYVGRVSVEKNLPMLAEAWRRVRAGDARLVVVGDGPYLARMRAGFSTEHSRAAVPPVFFLGFRHGEELSAIYASSDLFVFPSTTDTLGQVVMEAQCSGLPVLVGDVGGPKEVLRDGETGLVLPASEPARWAAEIESLLADEGRRRRMGRDAAAWMSRFDIADSFNDFWSAHEAALTR